MKHADSESVLRFAIRRSVFELQVWGTNIFLLTDRHDKILSIDLITIIIIISYYLKTATIDTAVL